MRGDMNRPSRISKWLASGPQLPAATVVCALAALGWWLLVSPTTDLSRRVPGTDMAGAIPRADEKVVRGTLVPGPGKPGDSSGSWPRFRGQGFDAISREEVKLARTWPADGPKALWTLDVGEGYASPAVLGGRVYLLDYDADRGADVLRCLSLDDGKSIWEYSYKVKIKRFHGMSRTVPAVTEKHVVALGPKCHVTCLDSATGEFRWLIDLVEQHGAAVPEWYAGQCPLIEDDKAILAPGGKEALMMAVDCDSGEVLWKTPNPNEWEMTHSSIIPMEFLGQRMFVYCAGGGVVGISAADGALLWETDQWRIRIANVPSPIPLPDGRVFLSGGYNAGCMMLQLAAKGDTLGVEPLFRLKAKVFGANQQTPILHDGHLYGVRPNGEFVCLDPAGKIVWTSGKAHRFGLGPFMMADGMIFVMDDEGLLTLIEATRSGYKQLAEAKVLTGHDSWGPMTLAGGRLIVRDLTRMVCLDVSSP